MPVVVPADALGAHWPGTAAAPANRPALPLEDISRSDDIVCILLERKRKRRLHHTFRPVDPEDHEPRDVNLLGGLIFAGEDRLSPRLKGRRLPSRRGSPGAFPESIRWRQAVQGTGARVGFRLGAAAVLDAPAATGQNTYEEHMLFMTYGWSTATLQAVSLSVCMMWLWSSCMSLTSLAVS